MRVSVGDRFADRYVVESVLGEGGMGLVLRARDEKLDRSVAVKVLTQSAVGDSVARARLVREARAVAKLEHPGIVHLYDVGETDDGGAFLVMELVRGRDARVVFADASVAPEERIRIVRDAARALQFAHDQGFVHRDIKPDNLMVRDDGRVTVLDFGLAKPITGAEVDPHGKTEAPRLTEQGTIAGTPAYLAPEQALARPLDARADQFALAVTAYEALTGKLPWRGDSSLAVIAAIMRDAPIPIRELAPELPAAVDAVFTRALAKAPDARYPDVISFAEALAALAPTLAKAPPRTSAPLAPPAISGDLANARTVSAPAEGIAPRSVRASSPARRARRVWMGLAGVLIAGGLATYALWPKSVAAPPLPVAKPRAASALVACPAFRTNGFPEPADPTRRDAGTIEPGWLGAAAATIACARIQTGMGAKDDAVRSPAELLGLPREPKDAFPTDPYGMPDARSNAVAEAKRLDADWLDGALDVGADGFTVDLALRRSDDTEIARATGRGSVLFQAVRAAMAPLYRGGHLREAPNDDAHLVEWTGATTAEGARALLDITFAIVTEDETSTRAECVAAERADVTEEARFFARAACADRLFLPRPPWNNPLDTSRAALDAMSSSALFTVGGTVRKASTPEVKRAVADALAERAKTEADAMPRASLAAMAAELYNETNQRELAAILARKAIQASPKQIDLRAFAWHRLAFTSGVMFTVSASHFAWVPWEPVAALNLTESHAPLQSRIKSARRAFLLGPHGYYPNALGWMLLEAGETQEAENVASRSESEWLRIAIKMSHLDFAGAMDEARTMALDMKPSQASANRLFLGMSYAVTDAIILGNGNLDFADEIVKRYIDPEPPLLSTNAVPFTGAVVMCMYASRPVAKRCLGRLEALYAAGRLTSVMGGVGDLLRGGRRLIEGDGARAAAIWGPLVRERDWLLEQVRVPLVDALDASGSPRDLALADDIEAPIVAKRGAYNGIDLAHVRSAKRALRRGDKARAHALAEQVLKAWGTLRLPVLDEIQRVFDKTK